jgi:hypothetical protein
LHTHKVGDTTPWWFDGVVVTTQLELAFFKELLVPFVNLFSEPGVCEIPEPPLVVIVAPVCSTEAGVVAHELVRPLLCWSVSAISIGFESKHVQTGSNP